MDRAGIEPRVADSRVQRLNHWAIKVPERPSRLRLAGSLHFITWTYIRVDFWTWSSKWSVTLVLLLILSLIVMITLPPLLCLVVYTQGMYPSVNFLWFLLWHYMAPVWFCIYFEPGSWFNIPHRCRKSHVEIRRSLDRLISTMGFPILVRWHLYIESVPVVFSLRPLTFENRICRFSVLCFG